MAGRSKATRKTSTVAPSERKTDQSARSLKLAKKGISTGQDFAGFMSALMSDLIEGKVPPQVGNATCNAGGKLLKVVEMQYKFGVPARTPLGRELRLSVPGL